MKNIMRNKEVKLFAVIFAVFIASMMLFATTAHAATVICFQKAFVSEVQRHWQSQM